MDGVLDEEGGGRRKWVKRRKFPSRVEHMMDLTKPSYNGVSVRDQFGLQNMIFEPPLYFMNSRDEQKK